jgi:hypothetical protein
LSIGEQIKLSAASGTSWQSHESTSNNPHEYLGIGFLLVPARLSVWAQRGFQMMAGNKNYKRKMAYQA